jgi:hypothetical protein
MFGVCLGCHTFALKKLAVMVNGTTYAKKIEVEHKKRKQKYRYRKIYSLIVNYRYIEQYDNTDIQ